MTTSKKQLLIIDDDETFCSVMARVQTRVGFDVYTAYNIKQAVQLAIDNKPAYALVDLKIGNESGLELVEKLVAIYPPMRIVVLTGYASISTAVEAIKLGAIQYLTKPAEKTDIVNALLGELSGNSQIDLPDDPMSVKRLEWEHLQKVLANNNGNISATAKALGMHRRTLQRKLQKHPVRQ
ncbi:MAG: response regulator transcription factor [Pseudomonadota bacterium]